MQDIKGCRESWSVGGVETFPSQVCIYIDEQSPSHHTEEETMAPVSWCGSIVRIRISSLFPGVRASFLEMPQS